MPLQAGPPRPRTGAESVGGRRNEGAAQGPAQWGVRGGGVASTHLGRLEGQPGAGAGGKPLKAPCQPYETRPLCLFTRGTGLGPRKGHTCSLRQKLTLSPPPRVPSPGAGKERGSGHGSCSEQAVIPSLLQSGILSGQSLPIRLTDANTEAQRGCVHHLRSHSQSLRGRVHTQGLALGGPSWLTVSTTWPHARLPCVETPEQAGKFR